MVSKLKKVWVNQEADSKVREISLITGLPMTKGYGLMSMSVPKIINTEIIRKPKSKKKTMKLTGEWEFEIS